MSKKLIKKINAKPHCINRITSSQEEFDSILMNPDLTIVEKTFGGALETNQVLFVIKDEEIDQVYVKQINDKGTTFYKEN